MKRLILAAALALALPLPAAAQDPLTVLRSERAKYGAQIDTTQAGALLDAVASKLGDGWGLLRKTGGNRCPQPGTGVDVSCDWLVNRDTGLGCDALGSGPDNEAGGHTGPATPQWCPGEAFDKSAWVKPTGGSITPPPPPPPPDLETARAISALSVKIDQLAQQLDGLARFVANQPDLRSTIDDLRAEINALRSKPVIFPVYKGRVLGQPFTLTPQQ